MDDDNDFTFCHVNLPVDRDGLETNQLVSDIYDFAKEEESSNASSSSSQNSVVLCSNGLLDNSNHKKQDTVGSLSFSVIDTTSSNQPLELTSQAVSGDAGNLLQKLSEQKNNVKKPTVRAKVPFEKGYSQMDWLKLTRSQPDLAGLKGQSNRRLISMSEVRQHQTEG